MKLQLQIQKMLNTHYADEVLVHDFEAYAVSSFSETYRFKWGNKNCFLKYQQNTLYPHLFEKEVEGLEMLRATQTFNIPEVWLCSQEEKSIFLIIQFIFSGVENIDYFENAGQKLARLHSHTDSQFGFKHDNYIGNLPQLNNLHNFFHDFFVYERLEPLVRMGEKQNFFTCSDTDKFESIYIKLKNIIPNEPPALLHGDLWHGNIFSDEQQNPILIDPAVYYGHREAELAFTYLFGNFPEPFYKSYHQYFPLISGFKERMDIYNLYPLLVHLHLFGRAYLRPIQRILNQFS